MAKLIAMLLGGPNGEMTASTTYLNQRYCMPVGCVQATLTDIGTEELSHVEMLSVMLKMLLNGCSKDELRAAGMDGWAAEFGDCPFPANWNRESWTAAYVGTTGDPIANIANDMAAEEKARAGYEGVIRMCDDPDTIERCSSCGNGKLSIINGSEKRCKSCIITTIPKSASKGSDDRRISGGLFGIGKL